jgi:hypothetical protein
MASPLENAFRRFLDVIVKSERVTLPPLLWEEVADHRYRVDGQGYTLCFASPLREDVLDDLLVWLHQIPQPQHDQQLRLNL